MKLWPTPSPEIQLLRQWRRQRRQLKLQTLPLQILLWLQCRALADSEAASRAQTDSSRDPRKPPPQIGNGTPAANASGVTKSNRLSLPRYLHRLRPWRVRLQRWLLVKLLSLALLLWRLSRGTRKR